LLAPGVQNGGLIVGIVADKIDDGPAKPILPEAFVPYTLVMGMYTQILVKSDVPPLSLLHAVQLKVNSVDHDQQTNGDVRDLQHWITRTPEWARGQLVAWLFGAFAGLALVLAAVGLYSVVSYTVVQRTNEFGIRIALGAQRSHVLRIVFRSMMVSVGIGIAAGLVFTVALNKVLASWAAESSRDPLLLLAAAFVLATTAGVACMLPAKRAAGLDPMKAIRYE
jgi:ABC-type antimicrobial peptide transport system permease subunit